jgi:hypothetical protein
MNDHENKEALVRAMLSGLGFDLESYMGAYTVTDRRAILGLPSAIQPMRAQSLEEITALLNLQARPKGP